MTGYILYIVKIELEPPTAGDIFHLDAEPISLFGQSPKYSQFLY